MSFIEPVPCMEEVEVVTDPCATCNADNAVVTLIPAAIVSTNMAAANPTRRGLSIFNTSSADIFIKLGAGASTTSFTFKGGVNTYYEVPFGYTGLVTAIWSQASGSALVTEVMP